MPKLAFRTRMPRPDDPDLLDRWATALSRGNPVETAAVLAGIAPSTAYDWIRDGEDALERLEPGAELGAHALFAEVYKEAIAEHVDRMLGDIEDAGNSGPKYWVAKAWKLERRHPQWFGKREYREVEDHRPAPLALPGSVRDAIEARPALPSPSDPPLEPEGGGGASS